MKTATSRWDQPQENSIVKEPGRLAALILDPRKVSPQDQNLSNERLLLRALIDQLPDFLFIKDTDSRFVLANLALSMAYGFSNADDLVGMTDFELHPPEVAQAFFDIEQSVIASGMPMVNMEESFPDPSGLRRWYSTTKLPLRNHDGKIVGMIGIGRDVSERKHLESFRFEQGFILEMIAKNAPLPSVLERLVLFMESQLEGIRGSILLLESATGRLRTGAAPNLPQAYNEAIDGVLVGPKVGSCGTAAYLKVNVIVSDIQSDGLWEDFRELAGSFGLRSCWSTPIMSHEGAVLGTFAMYSSDVRLPNATETRLIEITTRIAGIAIERQRSEDRIKHIAHHDALTGLPNRILLEERLSQAMLRADRNLGQVFVVFIDIDNFKVVNDGLGHIAGDQLLKSIAARMSHCVSGLDTVVRLGGDEFVILLASQAHGTEPVRATLQMIQAAISAPVEIEGRLLQVSCSMGISTYPRDGTSVETLLMNADAAMYGAKDAGRNNLQFYTSRMNAQVHERLALQEQMRHAVEREEFFLVYQPQVNLSSGRVFAVEALLRWNHPTLGLISPATFIPIAEESGLIVPIGDWVLRTACKQNKAWQDAGDQAITVAVNVSARQFKELDWAIHVENALRDSGLAPEYLELEVTESMLMHDVHRAIAIMGDLKRLGVHLAIDDFGTGYSSLSALKSFPVGRLKIDQSFVRDISFDENDKAIASAVISMGHKLGLKVVAEGVETNQQLAFLRENDCDEVQGYLFSKPVEAHAVPPLLASPLMTAEHRLYLAEVA